MRKSNSPFDVDKTRLLEDVLERVGVRYRRTHPGWQKVRCPGPGHANGDRTPSATVNLRIGQFHCFACGLKGDGFDLMMELEGLRATDVAASLGTQGKKEEPEWLF